jgi:hypothetical protein
MRNQVAEHMPEVLRRLQPGGHLADPMGSILRRRVFSEMFRSPSSTATCTQIVVLLRRSCWQFSEVSCLESQRTFLSASMALRLKEVLTELHCIRVQVSLEASDVGELIVRYGCNAAVTSGHHDSAGEHRLDGKLGAEDDEAMPQLMHEFERPGGKNGAVT